MQSNLQKMIEKRMGAKQEIKNGKIDCRNRAIIAWTIEGIDAKKMGKVERARVKIVENKREVIPDKTAKQDRKKDHQTKPKDTP